MRTLIKHGYYFNCILNKGNEISVSELQEIIIDRYNIINILAQ